MKKAAKLEQEHNFAEDRNSGMSSILINTPHIKNSGGIANFYQSLAPHFSSKVSYNHITFYPDQSPSVLQQLKLYVDFLFILSKKRRPVFLANPSFNYKSVRRDWVYLFLASFLARKTFVFWHGWDEEYFHKLSKKKFGKWLFRAVYGRCKGHFVLASDFKGQLNTLKIKSEIDLVTTCVDDSLIETLPDKRAIIPKKEIKNLLFLSRIEEDKGIFETLKAFKQLQLEFAHLRLVVAGSGSCLARAKQLSEELKIENIEFAGYVRGQAKSQLLLNSDALVFPTYHGEGLPLTLLEAMRFGLVIATTMMGGIKDIYRPSMGPKLEIKSVESIVRGLREIVAYPDQVKKMSRHNLQYVKSHFLASHVALKLEQKLLNK